MPQSFPRNSTFLVDTYDTLTGSAERDFRCTSDERAWARIERHPAGQRRLRGSVEWRHAKCWMSAGLPNVQVLASGGLDEFQIEDLLKAGAAIDGFGVGTNVGTSADYPWLDCVYKMVEYDGKSTMKLSEDKETLVGPKQVFRRLDARGMYAGDVIASADEPMPEDADALLTEVMNDGARTGVSPSLDELRQRCARELERLPAAHRRIRSPDEYPVTVSDTLRARQQRAKQDILRKMSNSE